MTSGTSTEPMDTFRQVHEPTRDFEPLKCEQQNRRYGLGCDLPMAGNVDLVKCGGMQRRLLLILS
jgi:hypothetical protein